MNALGFNAIFLRDDVLAAEIAGNPGVNARRQSLYRCTARAWWPRQSRFAMDRGASRWKPLTSWCFPRTGGGIALARSFDRHGGLHSQLPPSAASAPDAAVACSISGPTAVSPSSSSKTTPWDARAYPSPLNSCRQASSRGFASSSHGKAIARRSTPHSRPRWPRSLRGTSFDDRRRRGRVTGLAGANGAGRRGNRRRYRRRTGVSEFRRRHQARLEASSGILAGL